MIRRLGNPSLAVASVLMLLAPISRGEPSPSESNPGKILSVMERVANWQLDHPSAHPSTDWTQGAGDVGFMALAGISPNPRFRDAMVAMGEGNHWLLGPRLEHADDHCIGQTYAELYLLYRDPKMIEGLRARFDAILRNPSNLVSLAFDQPDARATQRWSWCDALFMGPPAWALLYRATGDTRYLDFALKNWWITTDYLYDRNEHLYFRDSTYFNRREKNGNKIFWSRGDGWVMAGLVRLLENIPSNHPDRPKLEALYRDMAARIITCQQPDGLWRASLLDPEEYPMQETSGSGFYTYALAWGVNQGLLERSQYERSVSRAWAALLECVEPDGKLTHVQPIGADPKKFSEDATEVYGVGAFLLAGSEIYRMAVREQGAVLATVSVTNPSAFYRADETIDVDPASLGASSPLSVMEGGSARILPSQTYAKDPAGRVDTLVFQVDLAPGETRRLDLLDLRSGGVDGPQPVVRTYARQVKERFNDIAWESDRIAHRAYSLELIPAEGTISSGIDVWTKRTRALVVDRWYHRANYHEDAGDGLDDYQVGRSRGCGGLGIWTDGKLYPSINFHSARIVTTGPVRSEFVLTYDAWNAGGRRVSETKRIRIDAGSNMSCVESTFSSDSPAPLDVAVGIAQRAPSTGSLSENPAEGWMTYWQAPDRDRGSIGCAVVLAPGAVREFVTETASVPAVPPEKQLTPGNEGLPPVGNRLALASATVGKPFSYYLGAGWSRSGDFPDEASWKAYVAQFANRVANPLKVEIVSRQAAR